MRAWCLSLVGALALSLIGACAGSDDKGGGPVESTCEKLCRRAGEANSACGPSDCVMKCQTAQPKCEPEYRAYVACMADAQMLGCNAGTKTPMAVGACAVEKTTFENCLLGGTGGAGGTGGTGGFGAFGGFAGGSGSGGSGGVVTGPCDPLTASCVGCGAGEPCGAGQACCHDDPTPTCKPAGTCGGKLTSACDGSEDCPGAKCCVNFLTQQDGTAKSGNAECSAAGSTVCCSATPGTVGCAGDKTVEQCVCAQDAFCCTTEWDAQCAAQVAKLGCGSCGADCTLSNASTGSGSSIKSVSCRTGDDCKGLKGQFSVPYSECCGMNNFVRACVSQTYASAIQQAGGSCN